MTAGELKNKYAKEWQEMDRLLNNEIVPFDKTAREYKAKEEGMVNMVIPTLGLREQIMDTIDTLCTQTYPHYKVVVYVQENQEMVEKLRKNYWDEKVEVIFTPKRIGWVASCNAIAKREGHLFCLADDVSITREVVEILVAEMGRLFPDGDGVLLTNQTYTMKYAGRKRGSSCAFPFIGNNFINRFPERQVLCPDYIAYSSDVELPLFAHSVGKCVVIPDAKIIHYERGTMDKEKTSIAAREAGIPDIETYFQRIRKGFMWGKNFDLIKPQVNRTENVFLTVLTRCHPGRPECVKRNVEFVSNQTDNDIQHLLLRPKEEPTGTPREKATKVGELIFKAAPYVNGDWVVQIDDDDMPASVDFVEKLRTIVKEENPDMIIFKCKLGNVVLPPEEHWKERKLEMAKIAGPNIAVKRELYEKCRDMWLYPVYESDYLYIEKCFKLSKKTVWVDFLGTCSQGQRPNNVGQDESTFKVREDLWKK